jgi:hypothetical protein
MSTVIKSASIAALLAAVAAVPVIGIAADTAKSSVDTLTTNYYTQALLDRMETTADGRVTKAALMKFMQEEWKALAQHNHGRLETTEFRNREYFQREIGD